MQEGTYGGNMPFTLEKHFENLAQSHPPVRELRSLWLLLRKRIEEELSYSSNVFVNYSLHDESHSLSVIQAVERFLGEERIGRLSATDTFMLLACIYSHDYGMSQTSNKIYDILGSGDFETFLSETAGGEKGLEKEDEQAIRNLLRYLDEKKTDLPLQEVYYSIVQAVQLYLRPTHWKGASKIRSDYEILFQGQLKKRFVHGMEGIVEICASHGGPIEELFRFSYRADGMVGDEYHPRLVAALLRLGDSLDMDNGRFPMWFVREMSRDGNFIPELSVLHFQKHEAISHLLITPDKIEITAHCYSRQEREKKSGGREESSEEKQIREYREERARGESYEVASLVYEWTEGLVKECHEMTLRWNEIAPADFGRPPAKPAVHIYVDDKEYIAENKPLQMRMSQETAMRLLEGASIYNDKYVGIREMLQNAVDASLLQLWNDLLHNRYSTLGLLRSQVKDKFDLWEALQEKKLSIFENYDITLEVVEDRMRGKVIVVVKDKGIGITGEEVRCIADIGSSKKNNRRSQELMKNMPPWLKPSGIFGIGLQSVFQLTDCIEFYTRQLNTLEQHILLHSYGRNHGKVEIREMAQKNDEPYFDNAIPGTNVKIAIDARKLQGGEFLKKERDFGYYDPEFDTGDELHVLFRRVCQACKEKCSEVKCDYFNIDYEETLIEESGKQTQLKKDRLRYSYFYQRDYEKSKGGFGQYLEGFRNESGSPFVFSENMAYYWDGRTYRGYLLRIRPCEIRERDGKNQLSFPAKVPNIYEISYKFNRISDTEVIYARSNRTGRLHAGFMKMEVQIFDDEPARYMNIDRDRLREGAIDEEELLTAQQEILKRWCEYLCETQEKRLIREREKLFDNMRGILISLFLLFYRNVPGELFDRFKRCFGELAAAWELVLEKDGLPVAELWNPDRRFCTQQPFPVLFARRENPGEGRDTAERPAAQEPEAAAIRLENIRRLPHRLVSIKQIARGEEALRYDLQLQVSSEKVRPVSMSEEACLYDYMFSFDAHSDNSAVLDYRSLQKKVYKPDSRFPHLLSPCYPRTFRRGRNMNSDLDYCIKCYILSPLDRTAAEILGWGLDKGEDVWTLFHESVMKCDQLGKCVDYIFRKRFADADGGEAEETKERIREEYGRFLSRFYRLLTENRALVTGQFAERE